MADSEGFDRRRHRFPESRFFEDLAVGERFYIPSRTVTEANFAAFQTVSADNHPIHYDVEYCRERGHPGPLAHGFQVLCFTAAGAGTFAHVIGESLIAFIEQSSKFLKPVYPGDTLYPSLAVAALQTQRTTGVVTIAVTVHNQNNDLVLSGDEALGSSLAIRARHIEMSHRPHRARSERRDEHARLLRARGDRQGIGEALLKAADDDVGLHRREVEPDPGNAGELLGDEAGIGVVFREPRHIVVERVQPGGGEDARLPHRAAEHAAYAHGARNPCCVAGENAADRAAEPLR